MPVCAVAIAPLPMRRCPATPTCPASTTSSSMTVLPAMPTCAASSARAPDADAVRDLHEVVDLRAGANPRFADRGPIDRRVGADLDVVFDHDAAACCGIFRCVPSACLTKPKPSLPITAPSCTITRWPTTTRSRMDTCEWTTQSSPMLDAGADHGVGINDRARADRRAGSDRHKRSDRHVGPERRVGGDAAQPIDALGGRRGLHEQRDGVREGEVGIVGAQHGAGRGNGADGVARRGRGKNDRRRARLAEQRLIARVGDEGEVARARLLDAGDAGNLDVSDGSRPRSPGKAAVQPVSDVAQLQGNVRISHPRVSCITLNSKPSCHP